MYNVNIVIIKIFDALFNFIILSTFYAKFSYLLIYIYNITVFIQMFSMRDKNME